MLDDYVRHHAELHGNDLAVIHKGPAVPYWKFEADIRRAVHELGDLKVEPGQSVSVSVGLKYIDWVLNLALARLGIASAPPTDSESEFRVTDNPQEPGNNVLLLSLEQLRRIVGGSERKLVRRRADPKMMGRVFRTSGTTGEPKRIAISWNAMAAQVTESVAWHRDRRGPWWVTTGMHTPIGYYFGLVAILCRYPAVVELVPSAQSILEIKPRVIGLVPIHTEALLRDLPAATPSWPLSLVSVGAALSPSLAAEVRRRLTSDATSAYGCTETGSAAVTNLDLMEREPMAAGVILHGVNVRIVDDEGAELPAGELGRVCISSDKLAMGFLGEPQLTAEHFRDGWFYTTDLGRLREDGILFVEGRTDELMNLGGHKLLPSAIDTAVATCPGVKEAAAFAFTGRNGLDRCGIAVVAGDGFDEAAVARAAASRMMKVQRSRVMLVDSLPRNMMGKVERLKLREMMEQKVGAARV